MALRFDRAHNGLSVPVITPPWSSSVMIPIKWSGNWFPAAQISDAYPDVTAMKARDIVTGEWSSWTYGRLQTEVTLVSRALIETGLHRHHAAVIISNYNCPLWVISHFAAISAGWVKQWSTIVSVSTECHWSGVIYQCLRYPCLTVTFYKQGNLLIAFGRRQLGHSKMRPTKRTSTHKYFVSLYGVIGLLLTLYLLSVTSLPPSGSLLPSDWPSGPWPCLSLAATLT